ncbi:CAP domain-containing protein [Nocardioides litoris]|uniref:CAP domain-containing protein n=1 Tax=Nocardioides litoris TaxID=1926648 RepID=UPI00111E38CF|nr:CAP domain-containing protein [Nocardioides litoris]
MAPSPHRAVLLVTVLTATLLALVGLPPSPAHSSVRPAPVRGWAATPTVVAPGSALTVAVRVAGSPRRVELQRRAGTTWRTVAATRSTRAGRAVLRWSTPAAPTRVALRLRLPRAGLRPASVTAPRTVTVRRGDRVVPAPDPLLQQVLDLVNRARARGATCGGVRHAPVGPLRAEPRLSAAARAHALDMGTHDYFSHTSLDSRDPGDRITAADYRWRSYGENIAAGYTGAVAVVDGWLASPGHCRNLMGAFDEIGLGHAYVTGSTYGHYWVQVLATR